LYDELCPRLLSRLERVAASDAKYGERCRLENYAFLGEALRGLAAKLPALQQHWQVGSYACLFQGLGLEFWPVDRSCY
jgi:hypothetical protein